MTVRELRDLATELGMTDFEYNEVVELLGRDPNEAELAMYSVMWSEHCSYKSSRAFLSRFKYDQPWVVLGPGENAGVVDIGDGMLVALRIESHNHPSFVEPYQGAATGVGGILRDIFTMGARPVALWDPLRFGPLDEPHNRYLFRQVVAGIGGYGNAVGVPTLGGEVEFADRFSKNPLVNVMALGLMNKEQLVTRNAAGTGNRAVLLGSSTGRDGIGGASILASAAFEEGEETKRPSVQIGDPFEEKKLIEACLELFNEGLVVAIQDLGAAGISCATSESSSGGGVGMEVDLDAVHLRESGMTAGEILMSESQERMLAIVEPENLDAALEVAFRHEIAASVIGTVIEEPELRVFHGGTQVANLPPDSLTDGAPKYVRDSRRPALQDALWNAEFVPPVDADAGETLAKLLDTAEIGDRSWIYSQYDHMLFLNTVIGPGNNGSLMAVEGTRKGLAVSTDGDAPRTYLDPRRASARIVFEAALNVACTGARPFAVVDNLNFGNPEKPEVMWQLIESIEGIAQASESLDVPVVGGNVSLYNETDGTDIYPAPVVGMLGLADPMPSSPPDLSRAREGMGLWLVGPMGGHDFAGSLVAKVIEDHLGGRPSEPIPETATAVIEHACRLAHLAPVLHDVSSGGLAAAVAKICINSGVGISIEGLDWLELFEESPHRLLVALEPGADPGVRDTDAIRLGTFGGSLIDFGSAGSLELGAATELWRNAIPRRIT